MHGKLILDKFEQNQQIDSLCMKESTVLFHIMQTS